MKPITPEEVIKSHEPDVTDEMIGFFNDLVVAHFNPVKKFSIIDENYMTEEFKKEFASSVTDIEYAIQMIPRILKEMFRDAGWNVMYQKMSSSGNRYVLSVADA